MVIVGFGPAGYTAAVYAARAGLAPVVIAGSVTAGGALMTTTEVENFPGFVEGVQGPDLMESMRAQAERFGALIVQDDATRLDLDGDVRTIVTGAGATYQARAVILAMGSAYRKLGLPEEEIVVVGGGDFAMEEALLLTRFASKVTAVAWSIEVAEILGDEQVTGLTLRDTVTGAERRLEATGVFVAIGHDPRSELVTGQIDTDADGYVRVAHPSTRTNLAGVFAAGDLVDHTYRQAITAAGTGCAAAQDAQHYLSHLAPTTVSEPVLEVSE